MCRKLLNVYNFSLIKKSFKFVYTSNKYPLLNLFWYKFKEHFSGGDIYNSYITINLL